MMSRLLVFIAFLSTWLSPMNQNSEEAVVRAVLFYSPTCGHCQTVIQEVLPPLFEKYGDQLQIFGVNVSQPGAYALFEAALKPFDLEISGVPALFVGDQMMVGSVEIPEKFPQLIDEYLAQGGIDWPDILGLAEAISASQSPQPASSAQPIPSTDSVTPGPAPQVTVTPTPTVVPLLVSSHTDTSLGERFGLDPAGNALAVIVLVGMIAALIGLGLSLPRNPRKEPLQSLTWLIPVLCALGLGVAGYLAYVETTQVSAVCGPVGDCNAVQQSEYARLFGVPIGVLGLFGYAAMGIAWIITRFGKGQAAVLASLAIFLMSVLGVLFSVYLTFLEPFVIGATCAWCLTSAVLMTALMWLSAGEGMRAWGQIAAAPGSDAVYR